MMRASLPAILLALALAPCAPAQGAEAGAEATPIIAEVVGEPQRFIGRRVKIYGLVVEADDGGRRFMLQDVSQRPLAVLAPDGEVVVPGNQLLVSGTLRMVEGRLTLAGDELRAVKVVAGGGCC